MRTPQPLSLALVVAAACALGCGGFKSSPSVPACPAPSLDVSEWDLRTGPGFTLRTPREFKKMLSVGFDSPAAQFSDGARVIRYQVNGSAGAAAAERQQGARDVSECKEMIGGHEAVLTTFRRGANYYARAVWNAFDEAGGILNVSGDAPDAEGQGQALAAIRSVRFTK